MRRTVILAAVIVVCLAGEFSLSATTFEDQKKQPPQENSVEATPQTKVDVNHASVGELTKLPGITQALATRIIEHRPYRKLDDLVTRKVLGKKQFARIREYVVIQQRTP